MDTLPTRRNSPDDGDSMAEMQSDWEEHNTIKVARGDVLFAFGEDDEEDDKTIVMTEEEIKRSQESDHPETDTASTDPDNVIPETGTPDETKQGLHLNGVGPDSIRRGLKAPRPPRISKAPRA